MHSKLGWIAALLAVGVLSAGAAGAALQIVWGPVLGELTPTSVQIAFVTNLEAAGWVEIEGQPVAPGPATQFHKLKITGLSPGVEYAYRLAARTAEEQVAGAMHTFATPPEDLREWVFCAYGDTRTNVSAHRRVVEAMVQHQPRLVLHSGDLVNDGHRLRDWHSFFPVIAAFSSWAPLYPSLGNHEGNSPLYYALLPLPAGGGDHEGQWYSTVYGNCQIIALESNRRFAEQSRWLQDLLAQPRPAGVDWRVAVFHHPPYSSGPHPNDTNVQRHFSPHLEGGGVDLVFCGHVHYYERSLKDGLNYITVGGGGAPLYRPNRTNPYRQSQHSVYSFVTVQVTPERLLVTALDTDQRVLDQVTITR